MWPELILLNLLIKGSEAQKHGPHKILWMLWFDEKLYLTLDTLHVTFVNLIKKFQEILGFSLTETSFHSPLTSFFSFEFFRKKSDSLKAYHCWVDNSCSSCSCSWIQMEVSGDFLLVLAILSSRAIYFSNFQFRNCAEQTFVCNENIRTC